MEVPAAASPAIGFPTDGRCSYFVEKKKRFCRMVVAAGKRFCGEHAGSAEVCYRPTFLRIGTELRSVGAGTHPRPFDGFLLRSHGFSSFFLSKCSSGHRLEPR